MRISVAIAFLSCLMVVGITIFLSFDDPVIILDMKSAIMVIGGSITVSFICFPPNLLKTLFKILYHRLTNSGSRDHLDVVDQIKDLSRAYKKGDRFFELAIENIRHPFLKDAAELLYWLDADVTPKELEDLIETRVSTHYDHYTDNADSFRTLAKFPPAFGLMGTTVGMIALLQSIGREGSNNIGPAMAVALITTFYGLFFSNVFFLPMAENIHKMSIEDHIIRKMIRDGIILIQAKKPTKYIEEKVKSHLIPSKRGLGPNRK